MSDGSCLGLKSNSDRDPSIFSIAAAKSFESMGAGSPLNSDSPSHASDGGDGNRNTKSQYTYPPIDKQRALNLEDRSSGSTSAEDVSRQIEHRQLSSRSALTLGSGRFDTIKE